MNDFRALGWQSETPLRVIPLLVLHKNYQEGLKLNASEPRPPTNLSENLICSKVYKFSAIFLKNRELI